MINNLKVFTLIAYSVFLSGCSSSEAPSLNDVEQEIRGTWAECKYKESPQLEVTDMKRVNGINHGENYEMFISYNIRFLNDFKSMVDGVSCPIALADFIIRLAASQSSDGKKGDVLNIDTSFNMVKSENGWIRQEE